MILNKYSLIEFFEVLSGRNNFEQAGFQILALTLTLGMAIFGGLTTGLLMRLPFFEKIKYHEDMFDDENDWNIQEFLKINDEEI